MLVKSTFNRRFNSTTSCCMVCLRLCFVFVVRCSLFEFEQMSNALLCDNINRLQLRVSRKDSLSRTLVRLAATHRVRVGRLWHDETRAPVLRRVFHRSEEVAHRRQRRDRNLLRRLHARQTGACTPRAVYSACSATAVFQRVVCARSKRSRSRRSWRATKRLAR